MTENDRTLPAHGWVYLHHNPFTNLNREVEDSSFPHFTLHHEYTIYENNCVCAWASPIYKQQLVNLHLELPS